MNEVVLLEVESAPRGAAGQEVTILFIMCVGELLMLFCTCCSWLDAHLLIEDFHLRVCNTQSSLQTMHNAPVC